jgi:three-Cys-motif partner protein
MEILSELPKVNTLYVALIDPTGLQINFDTIRKLTNERRMDLIVTFPEGMAINRNIDKFIKKEDSLLDSFMGDRRWRNLYSSKLSGDSIENSLIDLYRDNLKTIGYQEIKSADEILIKSSKRALPLYYLLFASKHPLGHRFWSSISEIEPTGQRKLKF